MDDVDGVLDRLEETAAAIRVLSLDDPEDLQREADLLDEMNRLVAALRDAPLGRKHFARLRAILDQAHDREVAHAQHTFDDDLRRLLDEETPDG